jgi:hypothetical protein
MYFTTMNTNKGVFIMKNAGRKPSFDYHGLKSGDVVNIPIEKRNSFSQCLRQQNISFFTKKHDNKTVDVTITNVSSPITTKKEKKWLDANFIISKNIPIPEKSKKSSNEFDFLDKMISGDSFITGESTRNVIFKNAEKKGIYLTSKKINSSFIRIWKI